MPKRVHIVGRKNQGKTTLIVDLLKEYCSRGIRVGTIKHTHHEHELDTPGKDSHRHRLAGANVVGIWTRSTNAVFWDCEATDADGPDVDADEARYENFTPMFENCDLLLVEGHLLTTAPKIEVWRSNSEHPPLATSYPSIVAVVTDDPLAIPSPVWSRADITALATSILAI